ncbi:MAG: hypothetical protein PHE27_05860, partial [Alphaproteobacteria bacterium]|nr:hypothetical protein [Alphaproteobacteria bacterium]
GTSAPVALALPKASSPLNIAAAPAEKSAEPPSLSDAQDVAPAANAAPDQPPVESSVAQADALIDATAIAPAPSLSVEPQPASANDTAGGAGTPFSIPAQAQAPAAPAPQAQAPSEADQRIEMLSERVDALQKALDQANQQLNQIAASAEDTSRDGSSEGLEKRISQLEKKIKAPARAKTVKHKTAKKAPKAEEKAEAVAWVLRAAAPGQGWIAADASTAELKKVSIGDTVPGIGKITAIEPQGDSWVVRGTKGTIQ